MNINRILLTGLIFAWALLSYAGLAFTEPHTFTETARNTHFGSANGVVVDVNGTVFVANGEDGLRVYRYNGASFTLAGQIDTGGLAANVAVASDGTVFLGGRSHVKAYCYSKQNKASA